MGRIVSAAQFSQSIKLRVLFCRHCLGLTDGGLGHGLLLAESGQLSPQVVSVLPNLTQPVRVQSSLAADLLLSGRAICNLQFNVSGRVLNFGNRRQALRERVQRGVAVMFANPLQSGQPSGGRGHGEPGSQQAGN